MRDVLPELTAIWRTGSTAGVATVVRMFGSAPRSVGAVMVVAPDGKVAGSISGGCVEAAVYELVTEVVRTGTPKLQRFGADADDLLVAGLTCGGEIDIFAEPISQTVFPQLQTVANCIFAERPVGVATVVAHPDASWLGRRLIVTPGSVDGSLGSARADAAVSHDVRGLLAVGSTGIVNYGLDGERNEFGMEVFVASHLPRPRMIIFGANDFAAALAKQGALLGYRVTVCDARPVFATGARFRTVDEVVVDWPHRYLTTQAEQRLLDGRTVVCVLTHDAKFDVPVLQRALRLGELGYVGAMGSRRTHQDRIAQLRAAGLTDAELRGLASPIGLDLGACTPAETAVSIAAEIIARRCGGGGRPLTDIDCGIHHDDEAP
ncbi:MULTISPECIES: XdhC family protein [Mycobacterium]|uniref:XdhC family protein n=1 Tax=Mycobacterium TaxID=1763 RepID=UPI00200C8E70|nr:MULTISPECIES: XdhC/CoxI family protein [Mycobacterium]UQB94731.1 XdhC family protein [Mycobacterium intracellulare]WSE49171.1 XdhC/CoxI family protein [Mycobacterium sp. 3-98]